MNFIRYYLEIKREAKYQRYLNEIAITTLINRRKISQEEIEKGIALAAATKRSKRQFINDYKDTVYGYED